MSTASGNFASRRKLLFIELVAKVVLAFAIGLATSIALAGIVLLLAREASAAEHVIVTPARHPQVTAGVIEAAREDSK